MIVELFLSLALRPEATPSPTPTAVAPIVEASVNWDAIADCETEDSGTPEADADWSSTSGVHEGGLQFASSTWDSFKPAGYPDAAYQATREQQIFVAERVLDVQGIGAWPYCGRFA